MFKTQEEYKDFLAWAAEGSTLKQRMQSASGKVSPVPDYWEKAKNLFDKIRLPDDFSLFNDGYGHNLK